MCLSASKRIPMITITRLQFPLGCKHFCAPVYHMSDLSLTPAPLLLLCSAALCMVTEYYSKSRVEFTHGEQAQTPSLVGADFLVSTAFVIASAVTHVQDFLKGIKSTD